MSEDLNLVPKMVETACKNIDLRTEAEIKSDMKKVVSALINFIGGEDGRILDPNTDEDEIGPLFFKLVGGLMGDAITAKVHPPTKKKLEAKFNQLTSLHPLLKLYSNDKG